MQDGSLMEDFAHDDVNDVQSFHTMPNTFASAALDLSAMETVPSASHPEWQHAAESFVEPADDGRSIEFARYLDAATSMGQDDQSEIDACSVLYDGFEQTMDTGHPDHQAMQISRHSSVDLGHGGIPDTNDVANEVPRVDDSPPDTTSPDAESVDSPVSTPVEPMQTPRTTVDISDIVNDDDKAFDIVKALKEKGTLPRMLEKAGYQSPQSTASNPAAMPPAYHHTTEHNFKCQEEGCNKSFTRLCELKCVRPQQYRGWTVY